MNCGQVMRVLTEQAENSPVPPLSAEMRAHLDRCEECRAVADSLQNGHGSESLNRVTQQISAQLSSTLTPVSPLPPTRTLVLRTIAVFVLLPALVLLVLDTAGLQALSRAQAWGLLGVVAVSEMLLSLALCCLMVPGCQPRFAKPVLAVVAPLLFMTAACVLLPAHSLSSVENGLGCMALGISVAVPAGVGLTLLARSGAVFNWTRTGAMMGVLAGFTGATVLTLHCPIMERTHHAVWHGGVLIIGLLGGAALGTLAGARSWTGASR